MYNVLIKTANGMFADTVSSIDMEDGDNNIGLHGIVMFPLKGSCIYTPIPELGRESLIVRAYREGMVDLSSYYSIVASDEDNCVFDEEAVREFNKAAGTNYVIGGNGNVNSLLGAVDSMTLPGSIIK